MVGVTGAASLKGVNIDPDGMAADIEPALFTGDLHLSRSSGIFQVSVSDLHLDLDWNCGDFDQRIHRCSHSFLIRSAAGISISRAGGSPSGPALEPLPQIIHQRLGNDISAYLKSGVIDLVYFSYTFLLYLVYLHLQKKYSCFNLNSLPA